MIGATRGRVSFFMNKFRKMGLIDYDGSHLEIHSSSLDVVLHDLRVEAASQAPEWHRTNSTARRLPDDRYCRQREKANAGAALS
jgi:hypothetical protein